MEKSIEQWEKERQVIVTGVSDPTQVVPESFMDDAAKNGTALGVNHADRIAFLTANGYEVTRENMVNSALSAKPKETQNDLI